MELLQILLQIIIGLGILNVWLLRSGKATPYRGGSAGNLREEFASYGLSAAQMKLVGCVKISAALALLLGVCWPAITLPAAAVMALLMAGAVAMHLKIKDPARKSLPAASLLLLSLGVIALQLS